MLLPLPLIVFIGVVSAQLCSRDDCAFACADYGFVVSHCNFDFTPSDNLQTCFCKYAHGLQGNLQLLNRCVVCNLDGLTTSIPLRDFQGQQAICAKYVDQGEAAALTVAAAPASAVVAAFSSTNLPFLSSALCGAGSGLSSSTTTRSSSSGSPSSMARSSSSEAKVTSSAPATSTSTTPVKPTSAVVIAAAAKPIKAIDAAVYMVAAVVAFVFQ